MFGIKKESQNGRDKTVEACVKAYEGLEKMLQEHDRDDGMDKLMEELSELSEHAKNTLK